jgi:hypothetical protein
VVVQTSNFFGAGENRAFHLAVECSSLAARVNADGTLAGGNGAIASQLIQDHYRVTFDRDISACSWVATAAEGISRGVPAPAAMGIYGNGPDAVYVATADGAQSPFNLVVDC